MTIASSDTYQRFRFESFPDFWIIFILWLRRTSFFPTILERYAEGRHHEVLYRYHPLHF